MASQRHVLVAATAIAAALAGVLAAGLAAGSGDQPRPAATPAPAVSPTTPGPPPAAAEPSPRPEAELEMPRATGATDPAAALPGLGRELHRRQAARQELRRDFPASRIREGALVVGHPRHNAPVPPEAEVRSSSLATEDGRTHVGVVARVPGRADRVMRFYRIRLGRAGFTERPTPGSLSGAATFRRGPDSVTLVVRSAAADTEVTLHAMLRTGA